MDNELKALIGPDEKIMYEGKPDKRCYIFETIFNPLLPIAIIWCIFDFSIMGLSLSDAPIDGFGYFFVPFMLLHLMPVWIYLGGIIMMFRRYRNTNYIVTDRAVYISKGVFSKTFDSKPFAELSHIELHRGIFDQMFKVGDIIATSGQRTPNDKSAAITLDSIANYGEVFAMVKKLQTDIYADVMYPNDLRPQENHGYNTKYKK